MEGWIKWTDGHNLQVAKMCGQPKWTGGQNWPDGHNEQVVKMDRLRQ